MFNLPKKNTKRYSTWLFTDKKLFIGRLVDSKPQFKYLFEFSLPDKLIINGKINNPSGLLEFLSVIKTKLPAGEKYIVAGISGQQCLTKMLEFPSLENKEVDQAVRFQADNYFPLPLDQEYLDWLILEEDNRKVNRILACAAPKSVINDYLTIFNQLLLYPVAFEPLPIAIFRSLPREAKQTGLIVDLDGDTANLLFLRDGNLVANSLVGTTERLSEVGGKMIDYYLSDIPLTNRPKNICLIGQKPSQETMGEIQNLGDATLLKSNLVGLPVGREVEMYSFGALCNKEVAPAEDTYSINLLPKHLATKYWEDDQAKKDKRFYFVTLILSFFMLICLMTGLLFVNNRISSIKSNITINSSESDVLTDLMVYFPKVNVINRLPKNRLLISDIVKSVVQMDTPALISSLTYDTVKREIVITGTTETWLGLTDYRDKLNQLGYFKKISLPLSSLGKDGISEFRLVLSI